MPSLKFCKNFCEGSLEADFGPTPPSAYRLTQPSGLPLVAFAATRGEARNRGGKDVENPSKSPSIGQCTCFSRSSGGLRPL